MSTSLQTRDSLVTSVTASQVSLNPASLSRTLALAIDASSPQKAEELSKSLAEVLLRFSPRLSARVATPSNRVWFFLDLGSLDHWIQKTFGDEVRWVEAVLKTLESLGHKASIAIADTPSAAQTFAAQYGFWISAAGQTRTDLDHLPLQALIDLEGLKPWTRASHVDSIANFFSLLGFQKIGDLRAFSVASFQERWGALGHTVFMRLQGTAEKDPQPISPYVPTEPLKAFIHLDHPVSVIALLLHEVEVAMKSLFARLEGRRLIVRRLRVCLRCEYSNHEHVFNIEPSAPSREIRFFKLLLENRLDRIELLNPIKDLEIEVDPLPEKEQQDSFEQQAQNDETKLSLLKSLLAQEGASSGFAALQSEIWPENTWILNPKASKTRTETTIAQGEFDETGFLPKFEYAAALGQAPRPALLLTQPRPLEDREVSQLQFYSERPIERIEHSWWEGRAGPLEAPILGERRDYYVARDRHGRNLWLFQDSASERFYLHGAFD